jgi:hypothetical protein
MEMRTVGPFVRVGTADTHRADLDQQLAWVWFWHRTLFEPDVVLAVINSGEHGPRHVFSSSRSV